MHANLMLLVTAAIWGFAFVAQRVAMDHMGPFSFNGVRFLLGALSLLPLLLIVQLVQFGVRAMPGASLPGLDYFIGPLVAVFFWWPVTFLLLLPQYQPVSRDDNRPI